MEREIYYTKEILSEVKEKQAARMEHRRIYLLSFLDYALRFFNVAYLVQKPHILQRLVANVAFLRGILKELHVQLSTVKGMCCGKGLGLMVITLWVDRRWICTMILSF